MDGSRFVYYMFAVILVVNLHSVVSIGDENIIALSYMGLLYAGRGW